MSQLVFNISASKATVPLNVHNHRIWWAGLPAGCSSAQYRGILMEMAMLLTGRVETLSLLSARTESDQQLEEGLSAAAWWRFPKHYYIIKLDNYLFSGHMSDNGGRPSVATNHTVKLIHN